jgi:hypothetical protein
MILNNMNILTRDQFRDQVLIRDGHKCVLCPRPAKDAHHIIDRSLFQDGSEGYYLNNGVSLCEKHHLMAEQTLVACEELRSCAGITEEVLPDHFELENFEPIETSRRIGHYDHWGNIVLPSGMRIRGEMFHQENVQKVLSEANLLKSFLVYTKYPRTYHATWSPNVQRDDRIQPSMEQFLNRTLIGTIKMDGENSNLYPDHIHARSITSVHHESRSWIKAFHARIMHDIPKDWRLCGENMYAKHSIHYKHLKSFFYLFSIWDETNTALSWKETREWTDLLNIEMVPVFCVGEFSTVEEMKSRFENTFDIYCKNSKDEVEGYVIRIADRIPYRDFRKYVAKVVRKNHVQTHGHWLTEVVLPNELKI